MLHLASGDVVRRYYAVSLAYALAGGFLVGVYPLFLRARGLTQLEINSVLTAYFAVIILTDVPTGACADALGRRASFLLGCALRGGAFALYFFSHTYVWFLIAEVIDAVGTTFCNGAVDAWGVDALDAAGFEGPKDVLFSRVSQLSSLGLMTTAVIGASVASVEIAVPWLLGAAGFFVSGLAARLMREPVRPLGRLELSALRRAVADRVGRGIRLGFRLRHVCLLSVAEAILCVVWTPLWLEWPALFKDGYGVGVWVVGWVFCALMLAMMLGAEIVTRLAGAARHRRELVSGLIVLAGGLLFVAGLVAAHPTRALVTLVLMNVCLGAREPLARAWFNEQVGPGDRATMLSFRSTMATAGGSVGLLLGGYLVDLHGVALRWQLAGALALLAVPCYWSLRGRGEA
jgi:MFS family permease